MMARSNGMAATPRPADPTQPFLWIDQHLVLDGAGAGASEWFLPREYYLDMGPYNQALFDLDVRLTQLGTVGTPDTDIAFLRTVDPRDRAGDRFEPINTGTSAINITTTGRQWEHYEAGRRPGSLISSNDKDPRGVLSVMVENNDSVPIDLRIRVWASLQRLVRDPG